MNSLYSKVAKLLQTIFKWQSNRIGKKLWLYRAATEVNGVGIYKDLAAWLTAKP